MPRKKSTTDQPAAALKFALTADGKIYEGTLSVPAGEGPATLPMLVNSLIVNLADDHPAIHEAAEITLTARTIPTEG